MSTHLVSATNSSSSASSSPKLLQTERPPLPVLHGQDGHLLPPAHASLAHALRSLNNGTADSHPPNNTNGTTGPPTSRPSIPHYESPYARSNASTAPGSPRMYVPQPRFHGICPSSPFHIMPCLLLMCLQFPFHTISHRKYSAPVWHSTGANFSGSWSALVAAVRIPCM
jgi:hypothetical protein